MTMHSPFPDVRLATKTRQLPTVVAALAAGVVLGLLVIQLGVVALGIVIAAITLPWFVREPFRLYLLLIMLWPVLTLYLRISLPGGIPDISFERVLIPLIAALVISQALTLRGKLPGLGLWATLFVSVQLVSYVLAWIGDAVVKPDLVILLNSLLLPVLIYWLTKVFIKDEDQLKWLLYAVIVGSLIVCATGLYERVLDLETSPFPVTTGTASGGRYQGVAGGRAAGVMGNPAIYGAFVGVGALASLCCFAHSITKVGKVFFGSAATILTYGVVVSFTRSAWIAFLGATVVAQFLIKGLSRWAISLSIAVILIAGVVVASGADRLLDNPVVHDRVLERNNVTGRIDRMIFGWEKFQDRPLLGWGPGALDTLMGRTYPEQGFNTSHNTYLTLMVDGGIFMFLSFGALVAFWFVQAYQALQLSAAKSFERSVLGVMLGVLLIYLLSGLALELKFFGYFAALFWIAGATIEKVRDTLQDNDERQELRLGDAWPAR